VPHLVGFPVLSIGAVTGVVTAAPRRGGMRPWWRATAAGELASLGKAVAPVITVASDPGRRQRDAAPGPRYRWPRSAPEQT